ncbi:MAG: glutamate-5-semialdehyde dehydrogenase [Elusimicrobia bacterium]|nr:glutamate-5-semialdehyde dehydrogenase [Elusimicrobiota bacterium]
MAVASELKEEIIRQAALAKRASHRLATLSSEAKSQALTAMAQAIEAAAGEVLFRNEIDVEAAKEAKLSTALIDRLTLNARRVREMAQGLREIAALPDPVGEIISEWTQPNGLRIQKVRVPLGVVGIIYESRPNVTVEAAGLSLKAGNAVILRGGSEAVNSNRALVRCLTQAAATHGVSEGAIQLVERTDRQSVQELIKLRGLVDLIIARGSEEMIEAVMSQSSVPVLGHGKGVCHVFVDQAADLAMAERIAYNAKVQRPGTCNAMETLLVHQAVAERFLPALTKQYQAAKVELRGCDRTRQILPGLKPATEADWRAEYLDLILAIRVVESVDEAIAHINRYGSNHSDAIVTEDPATAERFLREVDSSAVFHNVSTRMHDGGVFGLGAEIGISTQKVHARGTMGVRELTTTKYVVRGTGQVRE